ncbi:phosphonoacetaldehyde hydrolase [Neptunomonas marina]|uniref:Phosphonoacetaldehyde hydrolase n=1 Tax=Neptunomonas marina TaxID=1815562 RepID=A0A437QEB9_9GAMM|nr:phosphonoacetaldehyde hydrolase [Neptunomonas marina]RVU32887.1 phosphonoacetaldehyde hydrolase [Neptunomonas marina]
MTYLYKRVYAGPVQAVVFDWAGTTVDFGSLAPIKGFCQLFEQFGVPITAEEARAPMGAEKREHIQALLDMPRVREAWIAHHGSEADDAKVDELYDAFVNVQVACIAECAQLIPGVKETFDYLTDKGIKVGANTGYSQEMIVDLRSIAAEQGYKPSSVVCATDVQKARPFPHMTLKNIMELEVGAVQSVIKVDDTLTGIEEGLNAGCWTVGVIDSGNEVGMDLASWEALPEAQKDAKRAAAQQKFHASGAHYVINTVADLPEVVEDIEARLAVGEQP